MLTCCLAATEPSAEITHVFASVQLQHKSFVLFSFQAAVCMWRCWCLQEQNEFKANTRRTLGRQTRRWWNSSSSNDSVSKCKQAERRVSQSLPVLSSVRHPWHEAMSSPVIRRRRSSVWVDALNLNFFDSTPCFVVPLISLPVSPALHHTATYSTASCPYLLTLSVPQWLCIWLKQKSQFC